MANEILSLSPNENDHFYENNSGSGIRSTDIGNSDTYGDMKGAIRFPDVQVDKGSIAYAGLYLWVSANGKSLSNREGNWTFRIKAVDEDDTGNFDGSNPFGRTSTSNYDTSTNSDEPDTGIYKEIGVTSCVNEVMSRSGWNKGNSIALLLDEIDDSCRNKYVYDYDEKSFLLIRKSTEPDFKPVVTPVSAPTFPSANSYGIKISYPGYDVKTATENQTYFTTRKKLFKIIAQGKINTTAGTIYQIAHGQSYKPFAKAFFKSPVSSKRYKIPRWLPGEQQDPDSDTTNGEIAVDSVYLKIKTSSNCEVYYYIFIDELV